METLTLLIHYTDCLSFNMLDKIVVLLQQSIKQVFIVYTCNTYFVMHWSM